MKDTNLLQRAHDVYKREGLTSFFQHSVRFLYQNSIRPVIPKDGYRTANSVRVGEKTLLDPYLWPSGISGPHSEGGIVSAHEALTQFGDTVIVVGGGRGVTAVRAAKIVGQDGQVIVYEGGKESVEQIQRTFKMNSVADICEVNRAIVGEERDVYWGDTTEAEHIPPSNLPDCDVLELDCEGSEETILPNLESGPRCLIVELHPYNFSKKAEETLEILQNSGYKIVHKSGHDGISLSDKEFFTLLAHSADRGDQLTNSPAKADLGQDLTEVGARWPVVIAAV